MTPDPALFPFLCSPPCDVVSHEKGIGQYTHVDYLLKLDIDSQQHLREELKHREEHKGSLGLVGSLGSPFGGSPFGSSNARKVAPLEEDEAEKSEPPVDSIDHPNFWKQRSSETPKEWRTRVIGAVKERHQWERDNRVKSERCLHHDHLSHKTHLLANLDRSHVPATILRTRMWS